MNKIVLVFASATILTACNSIVLKPGTLTPGETVYADRGGFTMRRTVKTELEKRGYKIVVGKVRNTRQFVEGNEYYELESNEVPTDTKYYVKVSERSEKFRPIWCAFNGIWWWNFNISIADQQTGEELLSWRGRGCADSSVRLLRRTLNKLEAANE